MTEQVDIKNDYFPQTKRNCSCSWLTVYIVFTHVCIVAYLLVIIKNTQYKYNLLFSMNLNGLGLCNVHVVEFLKVSASELFRVHGHF